MNYTSNYIPYLIKVEKTQYQVEIIRDNKFYHQSEPNPSISDQFLL